MWPFKPLKHTLNAITTIELFMALFEVWWYNPHMIVCFCELKVSIKKAHGINLGSV